MNPISHPVPRLAALALAALIAAVGGPVAGSGPSTAAPAAPAAPYEPSAGPSSVCTVTGTQVADATRIEIGQSVGLDLTIVANCPAEAQGRADILLGLDRSASMGQMGKFEAAKAAVRKFVDGVDFDRHRVGLLVFDDTAFVMQPLTTRTDHLLDAVASVGRTQGSTDIATAIAVADRELAADARPEAVAIIVLLTDGRSSEAPMLAAAESAEERGTVIFSIGLGPDAAHGALRQVATTPEHYHFAPGPDDLADIYDQIAATIRSFTVTDVVVTDQLGESITYVPGSSEPAEPSGDRTLKWWRAYLPPEPVTMRYQLQVFRPGRVTPSAALAVDFTDGDGIRRRARIVPAAIDVIVPDVHTVYLPLTWRNQCVPSPHRADIVMVLDVSSSMREGDKLSQAVAAAQAFLDLMLLPADQAAIVSYDSQARVEQELTGDRADLNRALRDLSAGFGTRLDQGLEVATRELLSARRRADNRPVIVFLSDGRQVEERDVVPQVAAFARALGIAIFTIALGQDADRSLLQEVAGDPARAYFAPGPADLARIYGQVAGMVGCR